MLLQVLVCLSVAASTVVAEPTGNVASSIPTWDLAVPKRVRARAAHARAVHTMVVVNNNSVVRRATAEKREAEVRRYLLAHPADEGWDGVTPLDEIEVRAAFYFATPSEDSAPKGVLKIAKRAPLTPAESRAAAQAAKNSERAAAVASRAAAVSAAAASKTTASTTTTVFTTASRTTTATTTPSKNPTTTATTTASTTSAGTCAPAYTAGGTTISGTGTLPKATSYVKRASSGQGLTLDGATYRIVGTNIYWLCNDENIAGVSKGTPTDKTRVREALAIAVAMGANTIRLTSCGTSVAYAQGGFSMLVHGCTSLQLCFSANFKGPPYSAAMNPSYQVFGGAAQLDIHDYVIYAAGQYGLRIVMPLTDNYDFYHGGKYSYIRFVGASVANYGASFLNTNTVYALFRDYVNFVMNRVNPYNGLAYKNDPTIMAWETGNELGGYIGKENYPPEYWTNRVASLIRGLSPKSLIIDGSDGFYNYTTKALAPGLNVTNIDLMSDHGYPRNVALLNAEIPIVQKYNKGFLLGEFDWTNSFGGDDLATYLNAVLAQTYMGVLSWSIQGHDSQCCAFVPHSDGYSMYYPNGNSAADQARILQVVQFYYRATGRTPPSTLPAVACPQPAF
ncbi:BQ5605_C007g04458 [Microbotryum silenes-dioicae]|uniref:mannan endo-1,4-beta-mannosidase n=1 Tax=Microbotryum silenes-dioicae TaxID=796604 RepID=A0A2X0P2R3_9BASI|nr:BQ5605_C007g04458 [Microbotryum silenes-dioicae]